MSVMRGKDLRYVGVRLEGGKTAVVFEEYGRRATLHHVMVHSPTGMDWGDSGSGAADLAHSILANWLELGSVSPTLYQAFKNKVVSHFDQKGFILTAVAVQNWLSERWSGMEHEDIQEDLKGELD
jgi:hypothetical protein